MKANLRTEFQSGSDYYKLLDIARKIEAESMSTDSANETSKSTHGKGKPKVGAITVDSTTAQQISQLQGAVKGLTNLVKGVQLNTNPTQSSQNSTSGTGQPTPQNQNSTPSFRSKGGRGRGRGRGGFRPRSGKILCYWCKDFVSEEEASHKIANCPYQSTARSDWWKTKIQNDSKPQIADTSQNSNFETNSKTFVEFDSTPRFRKGFRRKKGESPYICDMNVKFKKEKKQSTFLNPDPWARLVGSRNTAAIYIDGIATTALYDTGAELQLISKEFCEQNKLKIQPIEQLIECKGVVGTGLLEYDGYVEVSVQIPGRDFSEDHLFLVSSMMNSQKDMPVIVGNFFIDSLNKYLKNLPQEEFETLDKTIQNVYFARIEASRIKEQYGCEPPLGFVRTTKVYTIPANSHIDQNQTWWLECQCGE